MSSPILYGTRQVAGPRLMISEHSAHVSTFLHSRLFSIGANNGQIRTIRPLDFETGKVHYVLIEARDTAPDSRSTVLNVTINVEDVEDMTPVFVQNLYEVTVPENERDYLVAEVEVIIPTYIYAACILSR